MSSEDKKWWLNMNENQYGPAQACYDAVKEPTMEMLNNYPREPISPVIIKLSEKFGIPKEKILLGSGSEALIKLAFQVYASDGKKMMLPYEGWSYFKSLCENVDADMIEYPVDELDDRWEYNMEKILPIYIKEKPALFMACCPNNPTGNSFTPDQIESLLKESPETVVIWDQAYYGFTRHNIDDEIKRIVETYPNVLVTRTFSKYYALAGVRIGYCFVGDNHKRIELYNDRYLGFNRLAEEIALAAMDSEEYYIDITKKQIDDRDVYFDELSKIDGVKPYKSEATFFIAKLEKAKWETLKEELPKRNIFIKFINCEEFPYTVRISLGTQHQNKTLIKAIKEIIG